MYGPLTAKKNHHACKIFEYRLTIQNIELKYRLQSTFIITDYRREEILSLYRPSINNYNHVYKIKCLIINNC